MTRKLTGRLATLLMLLAALSMAALATGNSVPPSGLSTSTSSIGPNDLKPSQCASLNLTNLLVVNGFGFSPHVPTLILGSSGPEYIFAGIDDDCIVAGAGNDFISGSDGDDIILAGSGADYVNGGPGYDICYGVFDPGDTAVGCEVRLP